MEIVALDSAFEPIFWRHVNQDVPHYFFFAMDWKYNRDETDILLALRGRRIDGMMLVYKKEKVQLRGNREAIRMLLEHLDLKEVELQVPKDRKRYILEKYEPTRSHELMLMVLHKGESLHSSIDASHPIVGLGASDAEQIAAIMNKADPVFWGDFTGDQIVEEMNSVNWSGIKVNGELASICRTRLVEGIGHIATVATVETYRNKGFATSLVSYSVKSILKKTSTVIIFVLSDNRPAIRVYEKVGFKSYKTYYFIRGKRR